jgi:hypothetical protein
MKRTLSILNFIFHFHFYGVIDEYFLEINNINITNRNNYL